MRSVIAFAILIATSSIADAADRKKGSAKAKTTAQSSERASHGPEKVYDRGLKAMRRGYYTKALEHFHEVWNFHRDHPLSVQAQLAIADVYFKKREYEQARYAYEEFARYHPRHKNLDYVVFQTGLSIYKRASVFAGRDQSPTKGAINAWTSFDKRFPRSQYKPQVADYMAKAQSRLARKELFVAKFYKRRAAWGAVQARTAYLLRRYPKADCTPEALSLLGRSQHAWGDVDAAQQTLAKLESLGSDPRQLEKLKKALAKPAGEKPPEELFVRPQRRRLMGAQGQ